MPATNVLQNGTTLPTTTNTHAQHEIFHEGETAGGLPSWRKGIYSTLGILTFIYLATTITLFYLRRHKISDIRYRPLRLNLLNSLATVILCVTFCFRTGFYPNEFPCFLVHWTSYIGFSLYFAALTCRVLSFTWVARYNIAKLRISVSCNSNLHSPQTPRTLDDPPMGESENFDFLGSRLMTRLRKFKPYVTDEWLTKWIIYPILVLAFITALIMQILIPGLSLYPLKTYCPFGPVYIPLFIFILMFLVVICPILYYILYGIRDAFGLRNELLTKIISGSFSFILFFIWELLTPKFRSYFGSSMFSYFSFMACHTLSITVPVWRSYRNPAVVEVLDSLSEGKSNNQSALKSKKYGLFERVLTDVKLFELYKACAAACFCTELILFLREFQSLKALAARCCTPSNREQMPPSTPKLVIAETGQISFPEMPGFHSVPSTPLSPSFTPITPCTKSIVDTVPAAAWIPFPYELKSKFTMFYDTFLDPTSDLSINLSGNLLNEVKRKIEKGQYDLSMYEKAREEVLTLLYVNTFEKFLKMYGSEVKSRKWN